MRLFDRYTFKLTKILYISKPYVTNMELRNLVYGLRRVGKTTLFYQVRQQLLDYGVDPGTILYCSFDVTKAEIEDVLRTYEQEKLTSS